MLLAGIAILAACKGASSRYEAINNTSDTVKFGDDTASQPKLIKAASMDFKVRDVEHTSETIGSLTTKYNGMLLHHNVISNIDQTKDFHLNNDSVMRVSSIRTEADITVKIPAVKLDDFMNEISHLSVYVVSRKLDITDKSLDYLSDQMKLKSRSQIIAQQKNGKISIKDPAAVLYLKDDMIDQQVNNMKIDDAVKYSVVTLHCFQSNHINKEVIVDDNPSSYQVPYVSRFGMALKNGVVVFGEAVLLIVNMWMLIIAGLLIWIGFRYYKRKHPKPILNNI